MKEFIFLVISFIAALICIFYLSGGLQEKRKAACLERGGTWIEGYHYEQSLCLYKPASQANVGNG